MPRRVRGSAGLGRLGRLGKVSLAFFCAHRSLQLIWQHRLKFGLSKGTTASVIVDSPIEWAKEGVYPKVYFVYYYPDCAEIWYTSVFLCFFSY